MLGRDIAAGHGVRRPRLPSQSAISSRPPGWRFSLRHPGGARLAGYYGKWVDDALMRATEFFQTVPQLAMAMVLVAIFKPSLYSIVGAIAMVSWPPVARSGPGAEFATLKRANSCRRPS